MMLQGKNTNYSMEDVHGDGVLTTQIWVQSRMLLAPDWNVAGDGSLIVSSRFSNVQLCLMQPYLSMVKRQFGHC